MSRIRIEGLLAAFPKLLGSGSKQQHTFIETESVRYVYQPMEQLFLVLVTNKASNIVQDLDTLRLLSKAIPDVAGGLTEDRVSDKVFELVFAFDEVIATGGYRESVSLQQIKTNMDMESHEEKLHKMIQATKMENAKDEAARRMKEIKERQREQARMDRAGVSMSGVGGMAGIGGGGLDVAGEMAGGSDTFTTGNVDGGFSVPPPPPPPPATGGGSRAPVKGMSLGGVGKATSLLDSLVAEDNLAPVPVPQSSQPAAAAAAVAVPVQPAAQYPLMLVLEERLTCTLTREGALENLELKGSLTVTAASESAGKCKVNLKLEGETGFTFQPHPKISRPQFDQDRSLMLKDSSKGFPPERPVGILRWSLGGTDIQVPLSINCWPEEEGGGMMNVNIEYSLDRPRMSLHDVNILIPLTTSEAPSVVQVDGTHKYSARDGTLVWHLELIDSSNRSGSLEFNVACRDPGAFFPISVKFSSPDLYLGCQVVGVTSAEDESPILHGVTQTLTIDSYQVD